MKQILDLVNYNSYKWPLCADLKVLNTLLGLQLGYTKYSCLFCLWNSRDRENHYLNREWPNRETNVIGKFNVCNEPLIDIRHTILSPLHVKLGNVKQFVKNLDKESPAFERTILISKSS